jgi:hypothetical protein
MHEISEKRERLGECHPKGPATQKAGCRGGLRSGDVRQSAATKSGPV